jgi:hypothetical protein
MDIKKYDALADLVREAREADTAAIKALEAARETWLAANEILTDRLKVFDHFVSESKLEDTKG